MILISRPFRVYTSSKRSVDLGNLMPDEVANASFELANHGKVPIMIGHVQSACGCTTIGEFEDAILPNKSIPVSFRFDASHAIPGRFDKLVLCKFSSPVTADVQLHLTGIIDRSFWLTAFPDTLDFREPLPNSYSAHMLYIFGGNDIIKAIPDKIIADQTHVVIPLNVLKSPEAMALKRVVVVLSPELMRNPGKLTASIDFVATGESHRHLTVRVIADIVPKPLDKE